MAAHWRQLKVGEALTPFALEFEAWLGAARLAALLVHVLLQKAAQVLGLGFASGDQNKGLDGKRGRSLGLTVAHQIIFQ